MSERSKSLVIRRSKVRLRPRFIHLARACVPLALPQILLLDEWNHPDVCNMDGLPSTSRTVVSIANALVAADGSLCQAPCRPIRTGATGPKAAVCRLGLAQSSLLTRTPLSKLKRAVVTMETSATQAWRATRRKGGGGERGASCARSRSSHGGVQPCTAIGT